MKVIEQVNEEPTRTTYKRPERRAIDENAFFKLYSTRMSETQRRSYEDAIEKETGGDMEEDELTGIPAFRGHSRAAFLFGWKDHNKYYYGSLFFKKYISHSSSQLAFVSGFDKSKINSIEKFGRIFLQICFYFETYRRWTITCFCFY